MTACIDTNGIGDVIDGGADMDPSNEGSNDDAGGDNGGNNGGNNDGNANDGNGNANDGGGSTGEGNNGEDADAGDETDGGATGEDNNGGSTGSTGATGGTTGGTSGGTTGGTSGGTSGGTTGVTGGDPNWTEVGLDAPTRAARLHAHLAAENYAGNANWKSFFEPSTGLRYLIVGAGSHKNKVRVFQNATAYSASQAWITGGMATALDYPDGSIVVKENYTAITDPVTMAVTGYKLDSISIMAKLDSLDETATTMSGMNTILAYEGDWFYVKITAPEPPALPVASHAPNCAGCHNGRTSKTLWPDVKDTGGTVTTPGGKADALVPYDYLFLPFCFDADNHAPNGNYQGCKAPGQ